MSHIQRYLSEFGDSVDTATVITIRGGSGAIEGLNQLPELRSLNLRHWGDFSTSQALSRPHLASASLGHVGVDHTGVSVLAAGIQRLDLYCCPVRDLRALLDGGVLHSFNIEGCPIDEHSFRVVLPELERRGVSRVKARTGEPEWRIMDDAWRRGLKLSAFRAPLYDEIRLMPAGPFKQLAGCTEAEYLAAVSEHDFDDAVALVAYLEAYRKPIDRARRHKRKGPWRQAMKEGKARAERGHWRKALAAFDAALGVTDAEPDTWHNKGVCLDKLADRSTDEALACHDRALALNPVHHDASYNRAFLLGRDASLDAGIADWQRHVGDHPDDHPAWINLGGLLRQRGELSEALEAYRRGTFAHYPEGKVGYSEVAQEIGLADRVVRRIVAALREGPVPGALLEPQEGRRTTLLLHLQAARPALVVDPSFPTFTGVLSEVLVGCRRFVRYVHNEPQPEGVRACTWLRLDVSDLVGDI